MHSQTSGKLRKVRRVKQVRHKATRLTLRRQKIGQIKYKGPNQQQDTHTPVNSQNVDAREAGPTWQNGSVRKTNVKKQQTLNNSQ